MSESSTAMWFPYGRDRRRQPRPDALIPVPGTGTAAGTLRLRIDDYDLPRFLRHAAGFGNTHHRYVVTPNVDHLIRLHDDATFRTLYASAGYVLLDSRVLALLLGASRRLELPVCAGSDLTAALFDKVIQPQDRIVLIGGTPEQADMLRARHDLQHLAHHAPPMGLLHDPDAVETCLRFVEAHSPFRYCLLAVGSPQQETLAWLLQQRDVARGLTLCVGASIDFLTGTEKRAPQWMRRSGLEWLYRLLQSPQRLWKRYLVRGPRVLSLLRRTDILLRRRSAVAVSAAQAHWQQRERNMQGEREKAER